MNVCFWVLYSLATGSSVTDVAACGEAVKTKKKVEVSHSERVVFPEIGKTKGDVVHYYEQIAPRALPHGVGRPFSMKRYPKGLSAPGFFQKNVPPHYPESIGRLSVPRSPSASKKHGKKAAPRRNVTVYPIVREAEHLAYLAQGLSRGRSHPAFGGGR